MQRIWKTIPGYEPIYLVSNFGEIKRISYYCNSAYKDTPVRRLLPEKLLGGNKLSTKGYKRINIKGKVKFVHNLIALAFLGPAEGLQVNHKDGIKTNNNIENLEYVTNQENRNHAKRIGLIARRENGLGKITVKEISIIKQMYKTGILQRDIAEVFNVSQQTISKIVRQI